MEELREKLESGDIEKALGLRMAQHVRQGLTETHAMLLYRADDLRDAVEEFLLGQMRRDAAPKWSGDYRRRAEVIEEMAFVIETDDFPSVVVAAATLWRPDAAGQFLEGHMPSLPFLPGFSCASSWPRAKDWGLSLIDVHGLEGAPAKARPPSLAA